MFFLTLLIFNIGFAILIKLFCKLTCGFYKNHNHLVGKVAIVTGGNTGIGYETAKNFAERGARVIIGCRNEIRGLNARDNIIKETGNKNISYYPLDLSSLKSVKEFANKIILEEKRLDILVNNAGVSESQNVKTEDGLLFAMQVNHFGPFLLTSLLLNMLKSSAPSRIVNVSASQYKYGTIGVHDLNMEKEEKFSSAKVYQNTKLCNVLMTIELAYRLKSTGVTANCLHPGFVDTNIMNNTQVPFSKYTGPVLRWFSKTSWEGAQTSIYLAVSPEVEGVSGCFFSDCREVSIRGQAEDKEIAHKLWEESKKYVREYLPTTA